MAGCFRYLRKRKVTRKALPLASLRNGTAVPKIWPDAYTTGPYFQTGCVAYGSNGVVFMSGYCSDYNNNPKPGVYKSTDYGNTWTVLTPSNWHVGGYYYPYNMLMLSSGRIVVVSQNTGSPTSGAMAYSDDQGATWTTRGITIAYSARIAANGSTLIVCGGVAGSTYGFMRSIDNGHTWVSRTGALPYQVAYGNGVWLLTQAAGGAGSKSLHRSTDDGATFSAGYLTGVTENITRLRFVHDRFFMWSSNNSPYIYSSADGSADTWEQHTLPAQMNQSATEIIYDSSSDTYTIVGRCQVTRVFGVLNRARTVMTTFAYPATATTAFHVAASSEGHSIFLANTNNGKTWVNP